MSRPRRRSRRARRQARTQRLDGTLDDLLLYRRALTATEIRDIWQTNRADVAGAVLRLPF